MICLIFTDNFIPDANLHTHFCINNTVFQPIDIQIGSSSLTVYIVVTDEDPLEIVTLYFPRKGNLRRSRRLHLSI